MSTKLWTGKGGVYYHAKEDRLFTLEPTGRQLYDFKRGKITGRMYDYQCRGTVIKNVGCYAVEKAVYIGEL